MGNSMVWLETGGLIRNRTKFIYSEKTWINGLLKKFFSREFVFLSITNTFRIGFSLVEYITENINFHEMNKL